MKLLLAASRYPYPLLNGEDVRVFHFARHLAGRHEIHLLTYGPARDPAETRGFFRSVHVIDERPSPARPEGWDRFRRTLSPDELFPYDTRFRDQVVSLTRDGSFDALWLPAWELVPYADAVPAVPAIVDVMDDGVLEHLREIRRAPGPTELARTLKRLWVNYRFERKFFGRAAVSTFVSERDEAMFRRVCPRARTAVIANGVDADYFRPLDLPKDHPSIVFEGNMGFRPNADAAEYIAREILPRIRARVPKTRFWVVGKDPAPAVRALAGDGIEVTGTVADVRPYLSKADVFVCAMRRGAGIKNKILQAWSMSLPVVATTLASGGLRVEAESNILLRDTPEDLAAAVAGLLDDPARRASLGAAGRRTVQGHHVWEVLTARLEEVMGEAIARHAASRGSANAAGGQG
jgi:glycosyltransferase involved in cell wall biosynthesis